MKGNHISVGEVDTQLTISSLGSGSNGNAFLIEHGDTRVLLDAGVPIRTLVKCLACRNVDPRDLDAILLSHEHSDHVRALASLRRRTAAPILATRGTLAGIDAEHQSSATLLRALERVRLHEIDITPIPVSHDAREPVGFCISDGSTCIAVMTDLGETDEIAAEFAASADHLIIESNYDESMLRTGRYPAHLKRRIRSRGGHLSNEACGTFLTDVVSPRTRSIWLAHLSENNNRRDIAVSTANAHLRTRGHTVDVLALPRYNGEVVTWDINALVPGTHQSTLPF